MLDRGVGSVRGAAVFGCTASGSARRAGGPSWWS